MKCVDPLVGHTLSERLTAAGIQPSAQRLAIGEYVLFTEDHPSADEVLDKMGEEASGISMISRATVYNTLNLFVEKGLLRELVIEEGHVVFDPRLDAHHHFVDTSSGRIFDLPTGSVPLGAVTGLDDFAVEEIQVVVRGTRREVPNESASSSSRLAPRARRPRVRSRFGWKTGRPAKPN